jgi:DNA-binding transcriptional LysR family regulator
LARSIKVLAMPAVGYPSFDQLNVFAAVADLGSFSAAARRLKRAQSVISYTVAQLEQQLGVALFDRSGRLPVLTEAGRAVLADARRAGAAIDGLRARVAGLQKGLEAEVRVVVDVMVPTGVLVGVLENFAAEYPTVSLRLCVEALGGVVELVADGRCDLGVGTELAAMPATVRQKPFGSIHLVPVAAPNCALAQHPFPLGGEIVREATQIVLTDRTALTEGQDLAVLSLKTWRIGDLGAKHALLRAGLGWGNMPEAMVAEDFLRGGLVRLELEEGRSYDYPLCLIQRADRLLGPAATWLGEKLAAAIRSVGGQA